MKRVKVLVNLRTGESKVVQAPEDVMVEVVVTTDDDDTLQGNEVLGERHS